MSGGGLGAATSPELVGGALGAMAALGGLLLASFLLARRPRLEGRLAPYLRPPRATNALVDTGAASRPSSTLVRLLAPVLHDTARALARLGSGPAQTRQRLDRAGSGLPVEAYRAEQAAWALGGAGLGLLAGMLLAATRGSSAGAVLVLVAAVGTAGYALRDQVLLRHVARREARIAAELPTVAELLALAVAAGESPLGALERVARSTRGELAAEIERVLADVRAGGALSSALESLASRSGVPALTRFAEAVATAVDRGTPLAEVLRAQAQDVREAGRRDLMATGGRREVAMLVPVVLLILPVTVVFAVLPGLAALTFDL